MRGDKETNENAMDAGANRESGLNTVNLLNLPGRDRQPTEYTVCSFAPHMIFSTRQFEPRVVSPYTPFP